MNIQDQANNYAEVIVEQIANNFTLVSKNAQNVEPLAVGLFGEWGSGKTHQLKLIEQKIIHHPKGVSFPKTTIPIFFNAWRFEKEEHIILPLFETLLKAVENYDKDLPDAVKVNFKTIGTKIKLGVLSLHKVFSSPESYKNLATDALNGNYADAFQQVIDTDKFIEAVDGETNKNLVNGRDIGKILNPEKLESIYLNIPEWISKITQSENVNFVFLIDDLDRCLPENTLKMLESIKLFLDVPSCAFVLAVDDDVVERGVVHHYRDYLQQNNNTIIYMNKEDEENNNSKNIVTPELPITGHEYLEKMIQLPLRLPTPNQGNIRQFLEDHSKEWKIEVNANFDEYKDAIVDGEKIKSPYEELIDFFVKSIPPKPRKIKRVALLFESKLKLLKALELQVDFMLLAKMTLLELFSPKLLRFIQSHHKYYESLFVRLEEFRYVGEEEQKNSLEDNTLIIAHIKNQKYTEKFEQMYLKMMKYITEHYTGRVRFELDYVFDGSYKTVASLGNNLQYIIESSQDVVYEEKEEKYIYSENFKTLLFSKDSTSWSDAFKEDNLFAEGKAILSNDQLKEILGNEKAKDLRMNASWLTVIAGYASIEQIKSDGFLYFEMQKTTVTFDDYEEYCTDTDNPIPDDSGFGRSKKPVINVSWNDAKAYAEWLSKKATKEEGKKVVYKLPTEDEWYLACNAGAKTKWHFGDDKESLDKYAWYDKNSYDLGRDHKDYGTHEVNTKEANDLGLYDMHGNVWEWCEDWYDDGKDTKVLRGGSWVDNSNSSHSANRFRSNPTNSNYYVGFRLQRTLSL